MKPKKLYFKIFFSFLGVLIITEVVIFVIFLVVPGKHFKARIEQYTAAKVMILKEVFEDKIGARPDTSIKDNTELEKFITSFGKILESKVWLQKDDGTVLLKSFETPVPSIEKALAKECKDYGSFLLYHDFRNHFEFFAVIPINMHQEGKGSINILFEKMRRRPPEGVFALGLGILGVVIAILVIPVSRLITKPLNRLRDSALKIAEGDLSHRSTVKSRDEIGELGRALNHMADRLERMIRGGKELTANVSHELRSPLARIRIAEELLRERLEREGLKNLNKNLDDIREDVEELDYLIGRILALSKLDIHEKKVHLENIDPVGLLNELLERFETTLGRKGLQVERDISFDLPFLGNKEGLYAVFSNILDNALKFSPENGKVTVKLHQDPDQVNSRLNFSVTNTHEKLSEEDLIQIFEPFHRAESAPVRGTGLGLAIVQKIITRFGGNVEALNTEEGFCIRVSLPSGTPEEIA